MELEPLDPEVKQYDIPLDPDFPDHPPKKKRRRKPGKKRGKARLLILIPAVAVAAAILVVALNFTAISVRLFPHYALRKGAEQVPALPDPGAFGFLGEIRADGKSANCSGSLRVQTGGDGLAVLAENVSFAGELVTLDFSGYLSPHDAAILAPELTGRSSRYYGVSLDKTILEQTAGTGGDPEYGWYFQQPAIDAFQQAADTAREALSQVTSLGLSPAEKQAVEDFVKGLKLKAEGGSRTVWRLRSEPFDQSALAPILGAFQFTGVTLQGESVLVFDLSRENGALTSVSLEGGALEVRLDLGRDPAAELTPRLELSARDGQAERAGLAMAFTVARAGSVEAPHYSNAFGLLPRVDD